MSLDVTAYIRTQPVSVTVQVAPMRGLQGVQGIQGDAFKYEDFTPEQLELLVGPTGPAGTTDYNQLINLPALGTAATADTGDFAASVHADSHLGQNQVIFSRPATAATPGGSYLCDAITLPGGTHFVAVELPDKPYAAGDVLATITLGGAGAWDFCVANSGWTEPQLHSGNNSYSSSITVAALHRLIMQVSGSAEKTLTISGTLAAAHTAVFAVTVTSPAGGSDPVNIYSSQIYDAAALGTVPLFDPATGTLPIANGGTGATTAATARAALGIQSVGDSILTAADLPAVNAILDINRRRNRAVMCESDFFAVGSTAMGGITGAGITGGTSNLAGFTANHPGVAQLVANTSAGSGYYYGSAGSAALLLQGGEKATFVFMIGATGSTVYGRLGYVDSFSTTAPTDGIYLSTIGDDAGGATVTGKASNNTSTTTTSSSYTLAASTWVTGVVELSADAATATYSLYSEAGSLLWSDTITSPNLPTGAGRHTSYGVVMFRTNATTAAVLLSLDYACWEINRTLIR